MLDNTSTPAKTILYFITRSAILVGMILFFASFGYALGAVLAKYLFGVDLFLEPSRIADFETDTAALNAIKIIQVTITIGAMLIPAWYFPKALQLQSSSFLQTSFLFKPIYIVLALAIVMLSVPFISWLIEINAQLQFPAGWELLETKLKASEEAAAKLTKVFIAGTTLTDLSITLCIVALLPAIAEEFLFRGAIQSFLKLCFGNIHVAIIVGAIVFSAFHGQIYGFVPRMLLGILLGYLFEYSNSIWPGVLAHFVNNALAVCISFFKLEQSSMSIFNADYQFETGTILLSAVLCVALVFAMYIAQPKKSLTLNE